MKEGGAGIMKQPRMNNQDGKNERGGTEKEMFSHHSFQLSTSICPLSVLFLVYFSLFKSH